MKKWLREHSLGTVVLGLFLVFWAAQSLTGFMSYNQERQEHGQLTVGYVQYLGTGHFVEGTFENWESEFLQMSAYVVLTIFLVQKGSAESKKLDGSDPQNRDAEQSDDPGKPWPVRKGGWALKIYKHSLSIAFILLFLMSFLLHAYGGAIETSEENQEHGEPPVSMVQYMTTAHFWYESFQNWQSEFLAVFSIVVLSVYLREQGSPESKTVDAPHSRTGEE